MDETNPEALPPSASDSILTLQSLGWSPFFEDAFTPHGSAGLVPARVIVESRELYRLSTERGELWGELTGALRYRAESREDLPVVGDWVACMPLDEGSAILTAILPRRSRLARRAPGRGAEIQLIAANVDLAFLVTSLNLDLSLRRLERYLLTCHEGGVEAAVVLSKADLVADAAPFREQVRTVLGEHPVHAVSAVSGAGIQALRKHLQPGRTVAFLGSSGVGKSTLVNHLAGRNLQPVREIRETDDRGRHTTTRRELFPLPDGALLLDTPGMRELGVWSQEGGAAEVFEDIAALAQDCRFRDCQHGEEPGCAVREAAKEGRVAAERLESFHKLRREEIYLADRQEKGASFAERKKWKTMMGKV